MQETPPKNQPRQGKLGVPFMVAIAIVGGIAAGLIWYRTQSNRATPVKPAATAVVATRVAIAMPAINKPAATPATMAAIGLVGEAHAIAGAPADAPNPLFAPNYDPTDGKPTYVCGLQSQPANFALLQMQMAGIDVAHGFHLGLVPIELEASGPYALSEDQHMGMARDGVWDCFAEKLEERPIWDIGMLTIIVDESAGAAGIWGRNIASLDQMSNKHIGYVENSSAEFFVRYLIGIMPAEVRSTVQIQPFPNSTDAVAAFNDGKIDAVSAWEPFLSETKAKGGQPVVTTDQFRVVVDGIWTPRSVIAKKANLVQSFHDAWFDTIKAQHENVDLAAQQIAGWGHNDWTHVSKQNAAADFRALIQQSAQANLQDNQALFINLTPLTNFVSTARTVWATAGEKVLDFAPESVFDGQFVNKSASQAALLSPARGVNNTFSLAATSATTGTVTLPAQPDAGSGSTADTSGGETLAVLPCRKFNFQPESAVLTDESRRTLEICVLPALQQRAGAYLRIKGSAAWPGPKGSFVEKQIADTAKARAQAVADFLKQKGIAAERLLVEGILPPIEHRETLDPVLQGADRFVEMTVVLGGR